MKKLSKEEIQKLEEYQSSQNKIIEEFGIIEYKIQNLNLQKELLLEKLKIYKKNESVLGIQLQEKYGEGRIDLNKGEFID